MQKNSRLHKAKQQEHPASEIRIMVSFKVLLLAAAICVILFQAAIASQLSIYTGANCMESTIKQKINCTQGRGTSGETSECINFAGNDVSYKFRFEGPSFRLYNGTGCRGQVAMSRKDIACTPVVHPQSYVILCKD